MLILVMFGDGRDVVSATNLESWWMGIADDEKEMLRGEWVGFGDVVMNGYMINMTDLFV